MPKQLRTTGVSIPYGIGAMHSIHIQSLPKDLKHPARLLLLVLSSHASNKDGSCFPSQTTLAAECGMGLTGIQSNLKILKDFGLINIQNRSVENAQGQRVRMTNVYQVIGFPKFVGQKPMKMSEATDHDKTTDTWAEKAMEEILSGKA